MRHVCNGASPPDSGHERQREIHCERCSEEPVIGIVLITNIDWLHEDCESIAPLPSCSLWFGVHALQTLPYRRARGCSIRHHMFGMSGMRNLLSNASESLRLHLMR
jgi:hypothetical protein